LTVLTHFSNNGPNMNINNSISISVKSCNWKNVTIFWNWLLLLTDYLHQNWTRSL